MSRQAHQSSIDEIVTKPIRSDHTRAGHPNRATKALSGGLAGKQVGIELIRINAVPGPHAVKASQTTLTREWTMGLRNKIWVGLLASVVVVMRASVPAAAAPSAIVTF
jgi:hypothetical protein